MLTRGSQEELGQSLTMQPSTNFSLCILVWNLILDLVCVPWVAAGCGAERGRVPATFNHPPAGLHLYVQASLHAAHLHVLVQVSVHVALCCGQFHLKEDNRKFKGLYGNYWGGAWLTCGSVFQCLIGIPSLIIKTVGSRRKHIVILWSYCITILLHFAALIKVTAENY